MCAYARYWNIHSFNIHDLPIAFPTKLPSEIHHRPHYVSSGWRGDFSPDVPTYRCPATSSWVVPQSVRRNVLNPAGSLVLNRAGAPGKTLVARLRNEFAGPLPHPRNSLPRAQVLVSHLFPRYLGHYHRWGCIHSRNTRLKR